MATPRINFRERILEIARALPPGPRVFADLGRQLRDPKSRIDEIGALIKRDTALAAQILRVSNSVVFAGEQRTASVEEAVTRIGFAEVFRIVGGLVSGQLAEQELRFYGIDAELMHEHMLLTAFMGEELARECGLDPRAAYTAGLLRPIGMLVLDRVAEHYPGVPAYQPARDRDYLVWEGRVFGLTSCEIAAMILGEWRFPEEIVEAVRLHYLLRPDDAANRLACLLNLAGTLVAEASYGLVGEMRHWGAAGPKLAALGVTAPQLAGTSQRAREAFAGFLRRVDGREPGGAAVP
jgi:HD-like signal output (HDOD) protein